MTNAIGMKLGDIILTPELAFRSAFGRVKVPLSPHDDYVGASGPAVRAGSGGEVSIQAVTASFSPAAGTLSVFGDGIDNDVAVGRNAGGVIKINGGAVPVTGGTPAVANTVLVQAYGLGGNDALKVDERNGPMPPANLFGGAGDDTLTGGSATDMLFGQSGNDQLLGKGGADILFGGSENDTLTGGDGDDQMFGESGDDLMIWNQGDDTDLHEGGAGIDTSQVNGGGGAEVFTATANGARVRVDRLDPEAFSIDMGTTENLVVNMNGGNDTFSATGNLAALIKITVDGGAGNDTILGSNGSDTLIGGTGRDLIDGQHGNDVALLGAGNDVFQWDPGDGSDLVEGQDGRLVFNGSNGSEIFDASADGERVRFTRDLGNIAMDLGGVEKLELNALGGADTIVVNDLRHTGLGLVDIDLAGTLGGSAGDGQADTVVVNADDFIGLIELRRSGGSIVVDGPPATVKIANAEAAIDTLVINAGAGADSIDASALPNDIRLIVDGGSGPDGFRGSAGDDVFLGGDDDDFADGNRGNDLALLGPGDDIFEWDPGDGSDTVEGQDGTDNLRLNGSNAAETVSIVANGGRVLFHRDVGNVAMDLDDVEHLLFRALGGDDNIVVGDLSGTDASLVELRLHEDGQSDSVTVIGTNGADAIVAATDEGGLTTVSGLQAQVTISRADLTGIDRLTINGLAGDDVIDATTLDLLEFTANGGLGNDVLIGSKGDDLLAGGDGRDLARMGAGDDTFVWNPGDDNDTVEGQAGFDTLLFSGSNAAENITITANGERATFFRDIANVTMDLNEVEAIDFNALGGADMIVINDLAGTDATEVNINLAAVDGAGDGQLDTIIINATDGDDSVILINDGGVVRVLGLGTHISITGFEAQDRIVINGLAATPSSRRRAGTSWSRWARSSPGPRAARRSAGA